MLSQDQGKHKLEYVVYASWYRISWQKNPMLFVLGVHF